MVEGAAALHQIQLETEEERRFTGSPPDFRASKRLEGISFLPPEFEQSSEPHGNSGSALNGSETYTVNEAIDHMGFGWFQAALLCYSGLAWAADAMEMMLLSFLGPAARCDWNLSSTQESFITSVVFFGTMLGANAWGALSDARGRRVGFQGCSVFVFFFGLMSAAAPNYPLLLVARFMVGLGLGGVPVAFALFAEFCPLRGRGGWLIALQSWWTVGSMAEAGLAWAVLVPLGWRVLLALSALPFVLLLALYPLLPESPHFLAVQGRMTEAAAVLDRIARWNGRSLPPGTLVSDSQRSRRSTSASNGGVGDEEQGFATSLDQDGKLHQEAVATSSGKEGSEEVEAPVLSFELPSATVPKGRLAAAFKPRAVAQQAVAMRRSIHKMMRQLFSPALRRTTLMLLFIWFANAISYYGLVLLATTIHVSDSRTACTPNGSPNLSSEAFRKIFLTSTAELPGMVVAAVVVEMVSRKRTLFAALAMCGALTAALIASEQSVFLWGSRGAIMGAFAVLFIYTPEVFPTTVRSVGLGVTNSFSRIGGIMSPFVAVSLVQAGHLHAAEGILAGFCAVASVFALLLPIETKGRALMAEAEPVEQAIDLPRLHREGPQHGNGRSTGGSGRRVLLRSDSNASAFSLGSDGSPGVGTPNFGPLPSADAAASPGGSHGRGDGHFDSHRQFGSSSRALLSDGLSAEEGAPPREGLLRDGTCLSSGPLAEDR